MPMFSDLLQSLTFFPLFLSHSLSLSHSLPLACAMMTDVANLCPSLCTQFKEFLGMGSMIVSMVVVAGDHGQNRL